MLTIISLELPKRVANILYAMMTDYPLMGVVSVTWLVYLNFAPNHIFEVGETRHFKRRVLIDTEVY